MATTTIDSRGAIVDDAGEGVNVNSATVVSASFQLSGSTSSRNVMPYRMSTTLLDNNSGTIVFGGHYTINREVAGGGGSISGSYVMPTLASTVGSLFVIRNFNGIATHQLTGSAEGGTVLAIFTTGSLSGSAINTASATAAAAMVLPASGSVVLINTGDRFVPIAITAGSITVKN